ncbi:phage adaptor protein [Phenylobacterium sp.]|uniref:phage adaptor protein n=1 Tax=Phenylobacterium sp. TaxID=1871053 RepID=UPI003D2A5B84
MAITTYAELKAAAANWLVRGDLTARIPEFITLAEARLNRVLRTRLAETDVALSAVIGVRTIPLPAGLTEALALWIVGGEGRTKLRFVAAELIGAASLQGEPAAWTVDGATLAFDRPCDQAYPLTLRMLRGHALSDSAPTNGLLAEAPDVYLFATLCEAGPFLRDAELAGAYEAKLDRAIAELNAKDARSRAPRTLGVELADLFLERGR